MNRRGCRLCFWSLRFRFRLGRCSRSRRGGVDPRGEFRFGKNVGDAGIDLDLLARRGGFAREQEDRDDRGERQFDLLVRRGDGGERDGAPLAQLAPWEADLPAAHLLLKFREGNAEGGELGIGAVERMADFRRQRGNDGGDGQIEGLAGRRCGSGWGSGQRVTFPARALGDGGHGDEGLFERIGWGERGSCGRPGRGSRGAFGRSRLGLRNRLRLRLCLVGDTALGVP